MNTYELIIGLGLFFYAATCWALLDVARKDFKTFEKKLVWGCIAFIPFLGWIIYLIWGRPKVEKKNEQ